MFSQKKLPILITVLLLVLTKGPAPSGGQQQQTPGQHQTNHQPQGNQMPPKGNPQAQQRPPQGQPPKQQAPQQNPPEGHPQMQQMPPQGNPQPPPRGQHQMPPQAQQQGYQERRPPGVPPQGQGGMTLQQAQAAIQNQQMIQQQQDIQHQQMMQQQHVAQQQQKRQPPGVPPQQKQHPQSKHEGQQTPPSVGTLIVVEPGYAQGPAARIAGFDDGGGWLDAAPGVAMEYKVHVEAGKEDCYWQYVHSGATFYVSAQVLKGGDGFIGVGIRQPRGKVVHPYAWKANAEYEESDAQGGYYSVCLDNQFAKFSAKLVSIYITTFRYDEWEKFSEEVNDLDMSVGNFTEILSSVDKRIQVMRQFQQLSRGLGSRDYNVLLANSNYVTTWSLAQAIVVILAGITQVYFVKKLFETPKRGGKSRMAART